MQNYNRGTQPICVEVPANVPRRAIFHVVPGALRPVREYMPTVWLRDTHRVSTVESLVGKCPLCRCRQQRRYDIEVPPTAALQNHIRIPDCL